MNVCVQGLWHLGSVTAACLASIGHNVSGLDFDDDMIADLKKGIAPLFEPGLEALIQKGIDANQLRFSSQIDDAVENIDVLWIAYDTPVDEDDNADIDFVIAQVEKSLPMLPIDVTVLISSQMPVGSIQRLESIAKTQFPERNIGFACSPENLRLGRALDVFLNPDRIVVGVRTKREQEKLEKLLSPITDRIEWMSIESAEMTKHAINAFLATSVTFANEIAAICEQTGADAKEVERGLKTESRIGPRAYLSPGAAFAGGTLARDITFLNDIARRSFLITPLLSSVKPSNDEHKQWTRRKLLSMFPNLNGICVAIWGLTYKPGTDTLRRSMAVELCDWLIQSNVVVCFHDPAVKSIPANWQGRVRRSDEELGAVKGAQALIVGTEWQQYKEISVDAIVSAAAGIAVLDPNRFLSHLANDKRIKYLAVGTPENGIG
jgi:UDPglucose 6-dehydrogenase